MVAHVSVLRHFTSSDSLCNKLSQNLWLTKTHSYYHRVLEVRCPKIMRLAGLCSVLRLWGKTSLPCLFQLLETACIPWIMPPPHFIFKASSSVFLNFSLWFFCYCPLPPASIRKLVILLGSPGYPGYSLHIKASWLATLISLCHRFQGLGHRHFNIGYSAYCRP